MIVRKSPDEIQVMARAGALVARALEAVMAAVRPGCSTLALDAIAERIIIDAGGIPSFKGYRGFPATLCTSNNHQIVHGIPSAQAILAEGDVLSIDCGAIVDGFHGDSAVTVIVGDRPGADDDGEAARLVAQTRIALWRGLSKLAAGGHLGDIGAAVDEVAFRGGFGSVREYVGHGVGRALHESPVVPNQGVVGQGPQLTEGWVIAVEPMFTLGSGRCRTLDDGWTVVTADGRLAAHWEHTVALTPDGPLVLTARSDEPSFAFEADLGS